MSFSYCCRRMMTLLDVTEFVVKSKNWLCSHLLDGASKGKKSQELAIRATLKKIKNFENKVVHL